MPESFVKYPAQPGAAEAEAAGLRWLREASTSVVDVIEATPTRIATRKVRLAMPTADAAIFAGEQLATIHRAGASAFGSPPPDWEGPNFIGTQQQLCVPTDDWATFYVEQRVAPFVAAAVDNGNLHDPEGVIERALECISHHDFGAVTPARIHGDLWRGNLLYENTGTGVRPVFIDPAAHGGHPETDLAMLALFGADYFEHIIAGYHTVSPLPDTWADYIPVHQLHPLAVHAVTHSAAYGDELVACARLVVALLG
ncbi:fructosamine-3-kinase [Corynebacterium mustelae]|uniref:Fructosamine-3-kinase n=1 Tax=Corynebacterium mustelae TaxID=571915 RepID=A0A0G3H095_9CORY|nr:fructosamine kinase family protein [Corynebacterium mustelae]AKK06826.1 fructosamine-3-kinase [Corynebacterium mustelae]